MEVFVWVSAGEVKVFKADAMDDLQFIVKELNDHMSMWDRLFLPVDDLNRAAKEYGNIEGARKAIMAAAADLIKDYSDDRFEPGTGFTKVTVNV